MKTVSTDDCWLYARRILNNGYARLAWSVNGKEISRQVHVIMYENFVGPVPDGLQVDHLCRVKRCINPEHLELVTHKENMRRWRGNEPGKCVRGHDMTPDNVYVWKLKKRNVPQRQCKTCSLAAHKKRYLLIKLQKEGAKSE